MSNGRAAELARRASVALLNDHGSVEFQIHHSPMAFQRLLSALKIDASDQADGFPEVLFTSAFGAGAAMLARRSSGSRAASSRPHAAQPRPADFGFLGSAPLNPSFLYDGARPVEIYLQFPVDRNLVDLRTCLAIGEAIRAVAEAAAACKAPIMFLQNPSSSPPPGPWRSRQDRNLDLTNRHLWRASQSAGIRFTVALDPADTSVRLRFFEAVATFAGETGARVWLGDRRGDRRGGHWFRCESGDEQRFEAWCALRFPWQGPTPEVPRYVVPLTVTGPARIGTTMEIVSRLCDARVPIMACSIGALDEQAFIHFLLPISASRHAELSALGGEEAATQAGDTDKTPGTDEVLDTDEAYDIKGDPSPAFGVLELNDGLTRPAGELLDILEGVATSLDRKRPTVARSLVRAGDYRGHAGPVLNVNPTHSRSHRALWASWRLPARPDALATALGALLDAIAAESLTGVLGTDDVLLEYLTNRRTHSGDQRGRGKLGVNEEIVRSNVPSGREFKNDWCRAVEDRWRDATRTRLDASDVEVEFAWRELWLGRWTPLSSGVGW